MQSKTLITGILLGCSSLSSMAADLAGQWRGVLELSPQSQLVIGISIEQQNGQATLTLDSPNQGMFGYVPTEFKVEGQQVSFRDDKLKASFSGMLKDGVLSGDFNQQKVLPLKLKLLDSAAQARLRHEGSWQGDLIINASTQLPLVLNVAVTTEGYLATLDSPKQGSFGIPLNTFSIDNNVLKFSAAVLQASYEAKWQDDSWQGSFVQGAAMPLVFKKKASEPATQLTAPEVSQIPGWLQQNFGSFGAALAIIDGEKSQVFYHGFSDVAAKTPVTAQTAFEIGSVSKTMIGLLLADAVLRQEVLATAPLHKYLPQLSQHKYTLLDLASHHSGLPRLPANLPLDDLTDPYRDYDQAKLLSGLISTTPAQTPGYEYSNLGFGLLAQVLATEAKLTLDQLIQQRLFMPLGMTHSTLARPQRVIPHLAKAHQLDGAAIKNWQFQALAGAGAVVSTLGDMQKYAQAYLAAAKPDADPRFALSLKPQQQLSPELAIGMGWMIENSELYWHNGQTAGFSSYIGLDLKRQHAVILLSNVAMDVTVHGQLLMKKP